MDSVFAPQKVPYCLACRKSGHTTTQCHSTHGMNTPEDFELFRLCEAAQNWERHVGPKDDPRLPDKPMQASPGLGALSTALRGQDRPEGAGHHGFPHAGKFQPVVDQIIWMIREQAAEAAHADSAQEPAAIQAWRQARSEAVRATLAYNAAVDRAAEVDAVKGFGYTDVNPEFQAMSAASRRAHELMPAALDALYQWRQPRMVVVGAQSRFSGQAWSPCTVEHHELVQSTPADWKGYETRLVYAPEEGPAPGGEPTPGEGVARPLPTEPITPWEDPRVQRIYELLCSDEVPPQEQHWEGWVARRIVDSLDAQSPGLQGRPPAADAS